MDQTKRQQVLAAMQKDIDAATKSLPHWLNEPCAEDDNGHEYTPLQLFQEVKNGTSFGDRYAEEFLTRHKLVERMLNLQDMMKGLEGITLSPGSMGNDQPN